jgi:hypothetical protein
MIMEAGLSQRFWAEAVNTTVNLKIRSVTVAVKGMTPEEAWNGRRVDLSHLRVFGCCAFMHIPDLQRKKWDPKSRELVHAGYSEESKAYRLLIPVMAKIFKARDCIFFEDQKSNSNLQEKSLTEASITPMAQSEQDTGQQDKNKVMKSMEMDSANFKRRSNLQRKMTRPKLWQRSYMSRRTTHLKREGILRDRRQKQFPDMVQ